MPLSPYLVILPHPDKPGWSAAFSTRKGSLCLLPDEVLDRLRRGGDAGASAETLERLGVLVADPEAERAKVLGYLDELNAVSPAVTVAVILGMACNFACPYCYEAGVRDRGPGVRGMTTQTAEALAAFVRKRLTPGKTKLSASFYGGETLLYRECLRDVADRLRRLAQDHGASWAFGLVTNGSLLTPEVVDELRPLGLTSAQVTLDGPAESHDASRPFRDGRGSFRAIVRNLAAVKGLVRLGLGGNYAEANWRAFPGLFDEFEAAGLGPSDFAEVRFSAAIPLAGQEGLSGCATESEPWAAEAAVTLRAEVLRRGFPTPKPGPAPCMIDRDDAFTVDWDGSLYKCPGLVGRREFAVGDVWGGFTDYRESHGVQAWRQDPACRDCIYLPLCFRGCRFQRLQAEGSLAGVDCRKPFFQATLEPMLRQELRYRHGGPSGPA